MNEPTPQQIAAALGNVEYVIDRAELVQIALEPYRFDDAAKERLHWCMQKLRDAMSKLEDTMKEMTP